VKKYRSILGFLFFISIAFLTIGYYWGYDKGYHKNVSNDFFSDYSIFPLNKKISYPIEPTYYYTKINCKIGRIDHADWKIINRNRRDPTYTEVSWEVKFYSDFTGRVKVEVFFCDKYGVRLDTDSLSLQDVQETLKYLFSNNPLIFTELVNKIDYIEARVSPY
jgi:hypothetical protein